MEESPLFIKAFDLVKWTLQHTNNFPRSEKQRIGRRLEEAILDFYETLISASVSGNAALLVEADGYLTRFRMLLRLSREFGSTSEKQFIYSSGKAVEAGRLLGGWMKRSGLEKRV